MVGPWVCYGGAMRFLFWPLGVVLLLYLLYVIYFFAIQRAILFPRHLIAPPPSIPVVVGLEQMWLETSQGRVEAWFLPAMDSQAIESQNQAPAPLFIIAHGNGDLIDRWLSSVVGLRRMGIGVLLVEYPGYGRSQGSPSQRAIRETFLLAYDTIVRDPRVDPARIILFGHSVGGGAVAILASERPSAGMILFSTFTSVRALATRQWLPGLAARDPFDNLSVIRIYPHPVLIIHGLYDRTIPYAHGEALYAAAQNGELLALECDHGDCIDDWDQFWQDLRPFLTHTGIF
jgi:pimeloyl-ACP methyl ester carboxylesterase